MICFRYLYVPNITLIYAAIHIWNYDYLVYYFLINVAFSNCLLQLLIVTVFQVIKDTISRIMELPSQENCSYPP